MRVGMVLFRVVMFSCSRPMVKETSNYLDDKKAFSHLEAKWRLRPAAVSELTLIDIEADPKEFDDLAHDPKHASTVADLQGRLLSAWDPEAIEEQVLQSQRERLLIERAAGLS